MYSKVTNKHLSLQVTEIKEDIKFLITNILLTFLIYKIKFMFSVVSNCNIP
jgi:hypothetical protein